MKWSLILSISKTHLISRKKQSGIAALGVTFGIGTFITLASFMTGLNGLLDGLILNRTPHIHLYNEIEPSLRQPIELSATYAEGLNAVSSVKPRQSQTRLHNALPILNQLREQPEVKGAIPQVQAQVFYLAGSIRLNGLIFGADIMEEVRLFNLNDYIVEGDAQSLAKNNNGIILGAGIARKMSLKVGDRIQLGSVSGGRFPLKIVGLYQSGLADIDNVQSYVNLATAQRILGEGKSYISDINVKLYDMERAPQMAQEIEQLFGLTAVDIKTANAQFETGTDIRNLITYAVSITLLVVAGFGIYNILNMMIYEKMNDIAILKATGFSGNDVRMIFISQAMLIGTIGGLLGLLIGYGLSSGIEQIPFETEALPTIKTFPVNHDPAFYVIGIVFALLATFFAGYLPASKARKIDPVDIIRGQ
jgi:lipoprotein-releasing system permease protein